MFVTTRDDDSHLQCSFFVLFRRRGGWSGSGKPEKRLNDEEFANPANRGDTEAKSGKKKRRRRTSSNFQQDLGVSNSLGQVYDLQDSSTFAQRVSQERNEIQDSRMADLMRIAEIAGIKREPKANEGERSDESNQKLGKFEDDIFGDDIFGDDDDTLDVRVY